LSIFSKRHAPFAKYGQSDKVCRRVAPLSWATLLERNPPAQGLCDSFGQFVIITNILQEVGAEEQSIKWIELIAVEIAPI